MKIHQTSLTDNQWQIIKNFVNVKRKRDQYLRDIINAIFYLLKTGCQWRMLPNGFAPWNTVYYYYRKCKLNGTISGLKLFCWMTRMQIHGSTKWIARGVGLFL